jgi:hypothetical protein
LYAFAGSVEFAVDVGGKSRRDSTIRKSVRQVGTSRQRVTKTQQKPQKIKRKTVNFFCFSPFLLLLLFVSAVKAKETADEEHMSALSMHVARERDYQRTILSLHKKVRINICCMNVYINLVY